MGDFTATSRLVWLSLLAIPVGLICGVIALVLLKLIALFTSVFYYQEFTFSDLLISPANHSLGWLAILIPAVGGLIVGLMARFGSEQIRGHGIPEAMEAILLGRSRMSPKVAVIKPASSAIAIGSGGPFGAEGPIIMTGGAFGSLIAQLFNITAAERKALLVAGAAGGMSATFGTPIAAVLLAVELLLFEWKPRSFVPVAVASAAAAIIRPALDIGSLPLFEIPLHALTPTMAINLSAIVVGLAAGVLSLLLTVAVYTSEDLFHKLPIHWMWWPAIGGLVVGIGGLIEPRALGVGYDIIQELLLGHVVAGALVLLILVKAGIWAVALGSGTSGGVLAPLLIMGGILGALLSPLLPGDTSMWVLVSMAAAMGGTMRSPLTGTVFALELTYDVQLLLPLLIASVTAHGFTVLVMKRSILTEKVARRGHHITREYSIDPLEMLSVGAVMATDVVTISPSLPVETLLRDYFLASGPSKHQAYPVVSDAGKLLGIVTRSNLVDDWSALATGGADLEISAIIAYDLLGGEPIVAYPGEACRAAAERMAAANVGRLLVVSPDNPTELIGIVTRSDLLKARARFVEEEMRRERFIDINLPKPRPSSK